ncbi:MAG: Kazal-type serine protease inhibitor [Legionellaceae bacterium]|nr:Kazal-type serine protease inhibitor [Legionellaceae bacterium]
MFITHRIIKKAIILIGLMLFSYQTIADQPPCRKPVRESKCICTKQWEPVCGVNGRTYGNMCEANCAHATIEHEGPCSRKD